MRIAIITHRYDNRLPSGLGRLKFWRKPSYQIEGIVTFLRAAGHQVFYVSPGEKLRPADAAIVHVDQSVVGPEYAPLIAAYPVTINGRFLDNTKRRISDNILRQDSDWPGKVIVKSDLNARGVREFIYARKCNRLNKKSWQIAPRYEIIDSLAMVGADVWSNPAQVVEKYQPERCGDLYVLRIYSFMGSFERCNAYTTRETIAKGKNVIDSFPSEIPEEIRAARDRLGADYGKFDFAITPEGPVLYDANKTPGYLHSHPDVMDQVGIGMGRALLELIAVRQATQA